MGLMKDKDRATVREAFESLTRQVHMVLATSAATGEYSAIAGDLLAEVAELSPRISLETLDHQSARAVRSAACGP